MSKIYGIDLGTSNSTIGHNGKLFGNLFPSIVNLKTKKVGECCRLDFEAKRKFKTDISMGDEGIIALEASAQVLKGLVQQAKENGEDVSRVVISVPAFFSDNQRSATIKAAEKIGLKVEALVNEPTAAAINYSKTRRALTVVFDLGGGTFDCTVIDSRIGLFEVQATDGAIIGGSDLDKAIVRFILNKLKFRAHLASPALMVRLEYECEQAKVKLQKTKKSVNIDLSFFGEAVSSKEFVLTVNDYISVMKTVFKRAITVTKKVIAESIIYGDIYDLLLVGGSSLCPYLQEWIEEELGQKALPITYDPEEIVGLGATNYAYMIETGELAEHVIDVTKALGIEMFDGTVRNIIPHNSKLPASNMITVSNSEKGSLLEIPLYQGESVLAANNENIGLLRFQLTKEYDAAEAIVKVGVTVDMSGIIGLEAEEVGVLKTNKQRLVVQRK